MTVQSLDKCNICYGNGYLDLYLPSTETLDIDILPGFNYNNKMIIDQKGLPIMNGINGDLILSFTLLNHKKFKVRNMDLMYNLDITMKESLIGFRKEIIHLDSRNLTLSSDTIIKPNTIHNIKNEGLPNNDKQYGNLYIKYKVSYPDELTQEQIDIIKLHF